MWSVQVLEVTAHYKKWVEYSQHNKYENASHTAHYLIGNGETVRIRKIS